LRLLFLSRLHPKKGLPLVLEALALARARSDVQLSLTVAGGGDGAYVGELRALAARLGVADLVYWTGHVEGAAKSALLAGADLFVLPSAQENFGIAVAEAMAAGLPVLVSHEVALSAEVREAGAGAVVPREPAAIADAILHSARDLGARVHAGDAAVRLVRERFSWERCADGLEALYASVVGASEGAAPTPALEREARQPA
jgi:glycosyltransferase involved in cell wall biosynthesis